MIQGIAQIAVRSPHFLPVFMVFGRILPVQSGIILSFFGENEIVCYIFALLVIQ